MEGWRFIYALYTVSCSTWLYLQFYPQRLLGTEGKLETWTDEVNGRYDKGLVQEGPCYLDSGTSESASRRKHELHMAQIFSVLERDCPPSVVSFFDSGTDTDKSRTSYFANYTNTTFYNSIQDRWVLIFGLRKSLFKLLGCVEFLPACSATCFSS